MAGWAIIRGNSGGPSKLFPSKLLLSYLWLDWAGIMKEPATAFRDSLLMYSFIWAVLAVGCFQVLPRLQIASAAQLQPWLGPAYLAGLGGSLLAALGSMLAVLAETTAGAASKRHLHRLAWALGAVGFLGVLFPLGLAGVFFLRAAQATDWWQELFG